MNWQSTGDGPLSVEDGGGGVRESHECCVAIDNIEVEKMCQKREVQANKEHLIFGMNCQ